MTEWTVPATGEPTPTLAGFLRGRVEGSWNQVRQRVRGGTVRVDGAVVTDPAARLAPGQVVSLGRPGGAPRPAAPPVEPLPLAFRDAQVVVVDKPVGISTWPFDAEETDTAVSRLRLQLAGPGGRTPPLLKVHRIDKATSGLVAFARTQKALQHLKRQLREKTMERAYLCLVHGVPRSQTIATQLVRDRGDGLRGSTRLKGQGRRAVTHVEVLERLGPAALCRCVLETGRTHQIRIHLAEAGHPLVGEPVYVRRFVRGGGVLLDAPRLMLHAAVLGFDHPTTGERVRLESPLPAAFADFVAALRGGVAGG